METRLKINEIFKSIQGEGQYIGFPVLFIRLSGCNQKCWFCDTKYHEKINFKLTPKELVKKIEKIDPKIIVWTGGEPMLQINLIIETIIEMDFAIQQHLETNGTILDIDVFNDYFDYVSFSPKKPLSDKEFYLINQLNIDWDIKIVWDGNKIDPNMIRIATMVMPMTTNNETKNLEIRKKVWKYCVKHNIRYCPRIHIDVWNNTRGI